MKHRYLTVLFLLLAIPCLVSLVHVSHAQGSVVQLDHSLQTAPNVSMPVGLPDTVRVLAVMVEFQEDNDTRTSGTGKFGTIYPFDYGGEIIDPYPHDRAYFQAHLRFLENYVRKASGERTIVAADVLDGIVTVSKQIKDYSYRRNESEKPVADLAVEAWTRVDAQFPGIEFARYHMFIVFHAGRGRDIDLAGIQGSDPTPFDIPSLSFTLNGFRKHYGQSFQGISVRGGSFHITNSSIIPTTDNREIQVLTGGTALLELSINGLLAASFGTFAGLPDLFDTKRGVTGISRFGLMDSEGIFAYGGTCPPAPSAWEKQFLGWTVPREAKPGKQEYLLSAYRTDQPSTADVLRVPITSKEYWLLENRQRDPAANGQRISMVSGGREFELRFPKDTTGFSNSDVSSLKGVVVDVEDLDWSLPGGTVISNGKEVRVNGGILIWHIDEGVIESTLAENAVNANRDHRGVDLEQAAGPQDIGRSIPTVFGTEIGTGSPLDFWFQGNISPLYKNSFDAMTTPNTRSNSGALTHVTMDHFSEPGPLMSLDISWGDARFAPVEGFPFNLRSVHPSGFSNARVQTADIDGDGQQEVFVVTTTSTSTTVDTTFILGFRQDGTSILRSHTVAVIPDLRSNGMAPLFGDINGDGVPEMVVAGETHAGDVRVWVFQTRDNDRDNFFDVERMDQFPAMPLGQSPVSRMVIQDNMLLYPAIVGSAAGLAIVTDRLTFLEYSESSVSALLASFGDGFLAASLGESRMLEVSISGVKTLQAPFRSVFTPSGSALSLNMVTSDFDGDGLLEACVYENGIQVYSRANDADVVREQQILSTHRQSLQRKAIASADVNGDGRADIILPDSNRVHVFNYALAEVDSYPAELNARYALAARFPGEQRDAVFIVGERELTQLNTRARPAEGFPVPLPADASVALFPIGGTTPTLGIAAAGDDGWLYVFRTPNKVDQNSFVWRSIYADERNSNHVPSRGRVDAPIAEFFPHKRCYNWPNPTYESTTKIRFYVSQNADVTVKIYDLAGAKVDELHTKAVGGTDNEIDWNVTSVQTGVYLTHVKASAGALQGEKIIKIAVVK